MDTPFNGNLGLAERLVNSIIVLFLCPIYIVSKSSDPDGHELPFLCVHAQQQPLPIRGGRGG